MTTDYISWGLTPVEITGLVASGAEAPMMEKVSLVDGIPAIPPAAWFDHAPKHDFPYSIQFEADGQVHGYVSDWDTPHTGIHGQKVYAPHSEMDYAKYKTGGTLVDTGTIVPTGRLITNTVHPKKRALAVSPETSYYDESGACVADITVFEDEHGIYVAGATRPSVSEFQMRIARGSDWSPDWRKFNGNLEMVACLAVNFSGFVTDGLTASGANIMLVDGIETAQDFVIPGESYCQINKDGEMECLIGSPLKAAEVAPVASEAILERLAALEAYVASQEIKSAMLEIEQL